MHKSNPLVDAYLKTTAPWQAELAALRKIVLECGLTEELKWGVPCYTSEKRNIVLLGSFKDNCVLSFFKGALLKDLKGILVKPGENTQAARVIRFTSVSEIAKLKPTLKLYLEEAVAVEQAGLKVEPRKTELDLPEELLSKFEESPPFETAFNALTPGRQRAYAMYFSAPKQSKTRVSRIENYLPRILDGKGFNDCICGHSQKMPACDGSHKNL